MIIEKFFNETLNDEKIEGKSWMTIMTVGNYLKMVDLDNNPYQRNLLNLKFYSKLIDDLLDDTTIPPISVVYNDVNLDLNKRLNLTKKFIIIDGLQRTNCLLYCQKIIKEGKSKGKITNLDIFNNKKIYVELWERLQLKNILYKMVVLNTGQKKMDYSHQLDILNNSLQEKLEESGITVITTKEAKEGRPKENCFELATVTEALVSFINTYPISGKKNAAEFLFERFNVGLNSNRTDDDDDTLKLISDGQTYDYLVWTLKNLNDLLNDKYKTRNPLKKYNTFLVSLLASLGYCYKKNPENLSSKIKVFQEMFKKQDDPLRMDIFEGYYNKFKTGIGEKRRKYIFETFRSFFLAKEDMDQIEWDETYERFF